MPRISDLTHAEALQQQACVCEELAALESGQLRLAPGEKLAEVRRWLIAELVVLNARLTGDRRHRHVA